MIYHDIWLLTTHRLSITVQSKQLRSNFPLNSEVCNVQAQNIVLHCKNDEKCTSNLVIFYRYIMFIFINDRTQSNALNVPENSFKLIQYIMTYFFLM